MFAVVLFGLIIAGPAAAQPPLMQYELEGETLLERVAEVLEASFFDEQLRGKIPAMVAELLPEARAAETLHEEREVADRLLQQLPVSHLGLLSKAAHEHFWRELWSDSGPTLGFELERFGDDFHATWVLEGGPAAKAGLRRGHRVLAIDGRPPAESPRLDWRTDDSALPDPPKHLVLADGGETVELLIDTPAGEEQLEIRVATWGSFAAARESVRVFEREGLEVGYVHLWFIHINGLVDLVKEALSGPLAEADVLMIDLRGRGGTPLVVYGLLNLLEGDDRLWDRPVIALIDRNSRSAKDMMAYELEKRGLATLVGECTAGAVLPASFAEVSPETVLMFPAIELATYSKLLEGHCVEPDVPVEASEPYAPGSDPILERGLEVARDLVTLVP